MTVNGKDYEVLKLLGKGKGGYSYLVTDGTRKYVLKQIHHEPCDYYQFGDKLAEGGGDPHSGTAGSRYPTGAYFEGIYRRSHGFGSGSAG